ncbi:hypothetical protein [Coralloluteibacterium stylophorae]|uniref:DUF3185 domain-containing protein n=1 Tax=Coralloluteibacterium stylophorae TaxID=1776034 RepID=A0A8J7VTF0_9GAMM|nr:hypothetical protein [Coralloluteibacterium stylophorae]MBS7457050.1 hypothetical protein [Coralloluteibacterium stylophorae]
MRTLALVLGVLLLVAGGLISAGIVNVQMQEQVAKLGPLEINRTKTETPEPAIGWVLLGAGALSLVVGLAMRRR